MNQMELLLTAMTELRAEVQRGVLKELERVACELQAMETRLREHIDDQNKESKALAEGRGRLEQVVKGMEEQFTKFQEGRENYERLVDRGSKQFKAAVWAAVIAGVCAIGCSLVELLR